MCQLLRLQQALLLLLLVLRGGLLLQGGRWSGRRWLTCWAWHQGQQQQQQLVLSVRQVHTRVWQQQQQHTIH
jgi:hypothetical protein